MNQIRNRNGRGRNQQRAARDLIAITTALVDNKLILGPELAKMCANKAAEKQSWDTKGSFGSDFSFESFGSMGEDEAVIILNPN